MSVSSYHRLFISASPGSCAQKLAQKQHKHFKIMEALTIAASSLILKESIFRMAQRPGSQTRFNRGSGYLVTAGGRRNLSFKSCHQD